FLASCGGGGGSDSPVAGIVTTNPAGDSGSSSGDDVPGIPGIPDSNNSGDEGGNQNTDPVGDNDPISDPNDDPLPGDDSGSGGGSTPIVTQVVAGLQQTYYEPTDLRPGTTYYWKVVAEDGTKSRHSQTYRFTVE
ncbi:MAG: hypothetical protein IH614_15485, partial [Desulfuromonadales bacterium]|nr:hypothetical protein [Desulfuromonadales bacterium]